MRKTTIFRSSCIAVLLAAYAAAGAAAQEPDSLMLPDRPDVHVVIEGETLWDLADRYMGDPLLWPEIYRLNTLVVEDPHWIFPGEELQLGPPDTTMGGQQVVIGQPIAGEPGVDVTPQVEQVVLPPGQQRDQAMDDVPMPDALPPPGAPPPPPPTETAPTVFAGREAQHGSIRSLRSAGFWFRPVRRGQFYSAGFLTEDQDLPWGKVLRAVGKPTLRNLSASSTTLIYGEVAIDAPNGATYQVGDSLLIARVERHVSGWGEVVFPTGIVEVTQTTEDGARAVIIEQFHRVSDGQMALPIEPFLDPGEVVPVPIENGLQGEIIEPRDLHPLPQQQNIVFIDRGRSDGVALGDVFMVLRPGEREGLVPDTVGYMHVVHTRERSSSAVLIFIEDIGIGAGSPVQLVLKMPS
jgi:hypothetical protein